MTVAATNTVTTPTTGTSSSSSSTATDLAAGQSQLNTTYSSFLTLLTAQLQNQDPLSPMDTNSFTQQLVSMNGVQQQLLTNNLLQTLVNQWTGAGSIGGAVNLIGKSVTAQSSVQALQNGSATWTYNLPSAAASATLEVQIPTAISSGPAPRRACPRAPTPSLGTDRPHPGRRSPAATTPWASRRRTPAARPSRPRWISKGP